MSKMIIKVLEKYTCIHIRNNTKNNFVLFYVIKSHTQISDEHFTRVANLIKVL